MSSYYIVSLDLLQCTLSYLIERCYRNLLQLYIEEQKNKIKNYATTIIMVLVIVFVATLTIISIYDLFVNDITNNLAELCARYGFLVSPGC